MYEKNRIERGENRERDGERETEGERERERKEGRRGEGAREREMGKCGGRMRAKEIAYANLQKLYSKLWHSASIQYILNMNIIYLFSTKARVMSDSVNCNFARCAVRHFVSAHLTKNHVMPRGALPRVQQPFR